MEREQVIGHRVEEIVGKEVFETLIKRKMDECFEGKVVRYELRYKFPNLGERDLFASYFPIEGSTGVDRLAFILQDITERKRAEEELRLAKEKLAEEKVYLERRSTRNWLRGNRRPKQGSADVWSRYRRWLPRCYRACSG